MLFTFMHIYVIKNADTLTLYDLFQVPLYILSNP